MKIVFMYVDYRPRAEKIKAYSKMTFKLAVMITFLTMLATDPLASSYLTTEAFKLGNIAETISAIPMPLVP